MQQHSVFTLMFLFFSMLLTTCAPEKTAYYPVKKVKQAIQLHGDGSDPAWETAVLWTDFHYPWREDAAPATSFRALWTDTHFYFLYRAEDDSIICPQRGLGEMDAVNSDRVELFFKIDDQMAPYYNLEMDALGRVYDSRGVFYRKTDPDWDWPEGHLIVKTSIDDSGYWLEGSISLESLRQLELYQDDGILKAGLFRGEYLPGQEGKPEIRWISWIHPDSEKPDFHIPSAFGELRLLPAE